MTQKLKAHMESTIKNNTLKGFWKRARVNPASAWSWAATQLIKQCRAETSKKDTDDKFGKLALWCAKRADKSRKNHLKRNDFGLALRLKNK